MSEPTPAHPPTEPNPRPAHPPIAPGPRPLRPAPGDHAGMRLLLPVGRSPWAIAAGYAGLLSFAVVPAPLALALGIVAVVHIRRRPPARGLGRAIFAIVAGAAGTGLLVLSLFRL